MVAIENHTTAMADVRPDAERLLHDRTAVRAFLAGEMGWDCNHRDIMQERVSVKPLQEDPPTGIMDRFGKFAVADHIADLKVFIGNQVARRDQRVCLFAGKIFALPLHFSQTASGLGGDTSSVSRWAMVQVSFRFL